MRRASASGRGPWVSTARASILRRITSSFSACCAAVGGSMVLTVKMAEMVLLRSLVLIHRMGTSFTLLFLSAGTAGGIRACVQGQEFGHRQVGDGGRRRAGAGQVGQPRKGEKKGCLAVRALQARH